VYHILGTADPNRTVLKHIETVEFMNSQALSPFYQEQTFLSLEKEIPDFDHPYSFESLLSQPDTADYNIDKCHILEGNPAGLFSLQTPRSQGSHRKSFCFGHDQISTG